MEAMSAIGELAQALGVLGVVIGLLIWREISHAKEKKDHRDERKEWADLVLGASSRFADLSEELRDVIAENNKVIERNTITMRDATEHLFTAIVDLRESHGLSAKLDAVNKELAAMRVVTGGD